MPRRPIDRLRAICPALPEREEDEAWGAPAARVRGRIFAMEERDESRVPESEPESPAVVTP